VVVAVMMMMMMTMMTTVAVPIPHEGVPSFEQFHQL
jgi:hypothetical protein